MAQLKVPGATVDLFIQADSQPATPVPTLVGLPDLQVTATGLTLLVASRSDVLPVLFSTLATLVLDVVSVGDIRNEDDEADFMRMIAE